MQQTSHFRPAGHRPSRFLALRGWALACCTLATAHAETLPIALVGPLSGLEASVGRAYAMGLQLAFQQANKAGLPHGHTLQLVRADDHGRADETVTEARRLVAEHRPLALAGVVGDANLQALFASRLLETEKLPLVGHKTIGLEVDHPQVFNVRASSHHELAKLVEHLGTVGIRRVALFHENGATATVGTVEALLRAAGMSLVDRAGYPAGTAQASAAASRLVKADAQAILLVATSSAAAAFIEGYRTEGGTARLFAHSGADIEQLAKRLSEQHTRGVAIAQVVPNPYKITQRLSKEFNEGHAALANPEAPVGFTAMEGYIAGKVLVEAVRRLGPRPTREALQAALEGLSSVDLGGLRIGYAPGQRMGSRLVELSIVNADGKIRQ